MTAMHDRTPASPGESKKGLNPSWIDAAERRVNAFLNYGGIHLDPTRSPNQLVLAYQQGDLDSEIANMRDLSKALEQLADALTEDQQRKRASVR